MHRLIWPAPSPGLSFLLLNFPTYRFAACWWKTIIGMTASHPDSRRVDHIAGGVKVIKSKVVKVAKVGGWVFQFLDLVVVQNDGVKYFRKYIVRVGVSSIDTGVTTQMQTTYMKKGYWFTFRGDNSVKTFCLPSEKGSTLKFLDETPSEGDWCIGRQTGNHYLPS